MRPLASITKKQHRVLETIREFLLDNDYSPSVRQLGQVLRLAPATVQQHLDALEKKGFIKRTGSAYGVGLVDDEEGPRQIVSVPVLGQIAAGEPILAVEDREDSLQLPESMLGSGEFYALRVRGRSMVEDHILDGDLVVIRRQQTAENGDVVVALLEDGAATLKRLYREDGRFRLQPANAEMAPIYVDELQVQGKVTGIVRQNL